MNKTMERLVIKRNALSAQIKELKEKDKQTRKASRTAAEEQEILRTIKDWGGKARFIAHCKRKDDPRIVEHQCCDGEGVIGELYTKECAYLGMPAHRYSRQCSQRGRYVYQDKRFCGTHLKLLLARELCDDCASTLKEEMKKYDAGPLPYPVNGGK